MFGQTKIEVVKTDNGWVLEWEIPEPDDSQNAVSWPRHRPKTSGMEIFNNLKKLLKRIEGIL